MPVVYISDQIFRIDGHKGGHQEVLVNLEIFSTSAKKAITWADPCLLRELKKCFRFHNADFTS